MFVEPLTGRFPGPGFRRFQDSFRRAGITRRFEGRLDTGPTPPDDAAQIGRIIREEMGLRRSDCIDVTSAPLHLGMSSRALIENPMESKIQCLFLDLSKLRRTPLAKDPFEFCVVSDFIDAVRSTASNATSRRSTRGAVSR